MKKLGDLYTMAYEERCMHEFVMSLEDLKKNGYYEKCAKWMEDFNARYGVHVTREDVIRPYDKAIGTIRRPCISR